MSERKIYKAVFFDVGSTLVGLNPSWEAAYHRVFQRAGFDIPLGEVEQAVSYSWNLVKAEDHRSSHEATLEASRAWQREVEIRVMERLGIHPRVQEELFWKIIEAFENPATYKVYPDSKPVLEKLKAQGYRLGIISNWSWHLPELCQSLGLSQFFEVIITSARAGIPKPQPQIFGLGLEALEIKPEEAFHIGDTFSADIEGAWSVGMGALWLVRPEEQMKSPAGEIYSSLQKALKIESLEEIWPFLEKGVPLK